MKAKNRTNTDLISNWNLETYFGVWWGTCAFQGGASGKEPACQCRRHRNLGSIPWLGRSPGGGQGSPLQYSCSENPMNRGAWPATVHGVAESDTTEVT